MLSDDELQEIKKNLEGTSSIRPEIQLRVLAQYPTGDWRVLPYLTALLEDTTPCVIALPYSFAEKRWLAALALAKEYAVQAIIDTIHLSNAVAPLSADELGLIAERLGIKGKGGLDGMLEKFAKLNELGKLPRGDLDLNKARAGDFHFTPYQS